MGVFRTSAYFLSALLCMGWVLSGYVVLQSLVPEPGANMILMALPVIGVPMVVLGVILVSGVIWQGRLLLPWERRLLLIVGACSLLPFAVLVLLS